MHEAIYNETASHTLLSEFQLRESGVQIDSTCHRHGGTQQMVIQEDGKSVVVPLELTSCMVHFKHRLPNNEEVNSLKQYCLTNGDNAWNPLAFSDQVTNKCDYKILYEKKLETKPKSRKCSEDRGEDSNINHNCLVGSSDIHKTRLHVDAFVNGHHSPLLHTSTESIMNKMSFRHLTHYCMRKTEVKKAKVNKLLYLIQGRLFLVLSKFFRLSSCFDIRLQHKARLVTGCKLANMDRELLTL